MAERSTARLGTEIVVIASELASAIGRNKWQTREETLQKAWQRSDPKSFCFANALAFKPEVIELINKYAGSHDDVKEKLSLTDDWGKDDAKVIQVFKAIVTNSVKGIWGLYSLILKAMKSKSFEEFKERETLQNAGIEQTSIKEAVETLCKDELKDIQEIAKEVCSKSGTTDENVLRAVESKLKKDRGIKLEEKAVTSLSKEKGEEVELIPEEYEKPMEHEGVKWRIRGKIDGMLGDKVVEVKNRTKRFMLPEYDQIQLQCYMYIFDKTEGVLLERLKGEQRETAFPFDKDFWKNKITPALKEFVVELSKHVDASRVILYGKTEGEGSDGDVGKPNKDSHPMSESSADAQDEVPEKMPKLEEIQEKTTANT